jgi:predicted ATP-grasp superfamily ATP-dependent carboligase
MPFPAENRMTPSSLDRASHAVLVCDVHALGMIGVARSLGMAGYEVHAISARADSLGLFSRHVRHRALHPNYNDAAFLPWLDSYVRQHHIAAIVPSEGFLLATASQYERYAPLFPDALPREVWQRCMSKTLTERQLEAADPSRAHLPPGGVLNDALPRPHAAQLAEVAAPYYLKGDSSKALGHDRSLVLRCANADELLAAIAQYAPQYSEMLWQGHVEGTKICVSLLRHEGEFLAENMAYTLHTFPHGGGVTALRRSFWHEKILEDARRKVEQLEWQGVAYVEYLWDETRDRFWFIEINARYWAYLHLDLFAGKDFPRLQLDAHFGAIQHDLGPPRRAVTCRNTIPGEISYLLSVLRDPALGTLRKLRSTAGFVLRFADPTIKADLLYGDDGGLYWRAWRGVLRDAWARLCGKREDVQ